MGQTEDNNSVLVLNARSSFKLSVFSTDLKETLSGIEASIGGAYFLTSADKTTTFPFIDHKFALNALLAALKNLVDEIKSLQAAAIRVVHGDLTLTEPALIISDMRSKIFDWPPSAPPHSPQNLAAIDGLNQIAPEQPQFASFDTSFHTTNSDVTTRYTIPRMMETKGIRRYGFHGLSYAPFVKYLHEIFRERLPLRLLAFHFGNKASLCAFHNGQSIATTIGYWPLDGLTMGTRSGGIDAYAVLSLVEGNGLERAKAILNHESELLDLSRVKSDMRNLMLDPSADSGFAIEYFCNWSLRPAGSRIAAMEMIDVISSTGGTRENALRVSACILRGLEWTGLRVNYDANRRNDVRLDAQSSKVKAWVIPAKEDQILPTDALTLTGTT